MDTTTLNQAFTDIFNEQADATFFSPGIQNELLVPLA